MLNHIVIQGRLCDTPEIRYTQSQKAILSITLAVERDFAQSGEKKESDFISVVLFGNNAEFCARYMAKGSMAIITGRLQSRDWTDREGGKRRSWEIVADRVYFGEAKAKETKTETPLPADTLGRFTEIPDDGPDPELPF